MKHLLLQRSCVRPGSYLQCSTMQAPVTTAAEHSTVLEAKKAMRTQVKKQLKAMSPDEMREQSEAASSKS
jgi:hypothetical protein